MKRSVSVAFLLLLVLALLPAQAPAHAQAAPQVHVRSVYTLNRYGFATVNETVKFTNNGTSAISAPALTMGLGNISSRALAARWSPSASVTASNQTSGPFTFQGGQTISPGNSTTVSLEVLLNGVVTTAKNGSLVVQVLTSPSLSLMANKLNEVVDMPNSTAFVTAPPKLTVVRTGVVVAYGGNLTNVLRPTAQTSFRTVAKAAIQDFNPLIVYAATRTISIDQAGNPVVTDYLRIRNFGTTALSMLHLSPLTKPQGLVTVVPAAEPKLLNPVGVLLSGYVLNLAQSALNSPVAAGSNFTIVYQYRLAPRYYSVSGGQVTVNIPDAPPIPAVVDSYAIQISAGSGVKVVQGTAQHLGGVTPWTSGQTTFGYSLSVGWALDSGVPAASVAFVVLLLALFVSRSTVTEEKESEEESSTERASAMIKAFDEKTSLINGLWGEIESQDPNEMSKEFFDQLRGRMDAFRSRALQRLNEVKQKSTTQKFFDLVNQIHTTEREVDRAAKDKLNLYEQYHLKRMRKEVFDRLLPQYTRRLEKALNQLSDELHVLQKEAKLL